MINEAFAAFAVAGRGLRDLFSLAVRFQMLSSSDECCGIGLLNNSYPNGVLIFVRNREEHCLMYCPKCGTQNIEEAKFCRLCGTAFQELAKPALSLPIQPNYGRTFRPLFIGVGFLLIALISIFSHTGFIWWMMFPAISLVSRGVGRLVRMKQTHLYNAFPQPAGMLNNGTPQQIPSASYSDVRARPTGKLAPPRVTENTTRLLD